MSYWNKKLYKRVGGVGGPVQEMDFSYLLGAIIQDVGFHPDVSEGGLTIDFLKGGKKRRVIFGFNELGIWKQWEGEIENPSKQDLLLEKIEETVQSDDWCLVDIEDDPKQRCYHFKSENKELLCLNISNIKVLPEEMRRPFSIQDKQKRDDAVLMALSVGAL